MSEQITIESILFGKMLEKDICNTKWTMTKVGTQHKEDITVVFNSDYTISISKDVSIPKKWRYVGPNQIEGADLAQTPIIFFNSGRLVIFMGTAIEYIGERVV